MVPLMFAVGLQPKPQTHKQVPASENRSLSMEISLAVLSLQSLRITSKH